MCASSRETVIARNVADILSLLPDADLPVLLNGKDNRANKLHCPYAAGHLRVTTYTNRSSLAICHCACALCDVEDLCYLCCSLCTVGPPQRLLRYILQDRTPDLVEFRPVLAEDCWNPIPTAFS